MIRSGSPVLASVCRKPSTSASTETSTPTTPAMPTTTTSDEPTRCETLRRFITVISTIWLSVCMDGLGAPGQRLYDHEPPRAQGGRHTHEKRQDQRHCGAESPDAGRHKEGGKATAGDAVEHGEEDGGGAQARTGAEEQEQDGLGQDQCRDSSVREPQGLEDGELVTAFPD